jgi:hypothetical protein
VLNRLSKPLALQRLNDDNELGRNDMQVNMGTLDKWIRAALVVVLLGVGFVVGNWIQWVFYGFAVMLTVTIFTGFCGIYRLFGIQTCPLKK